MERTLIYLSTEERQGPQSLARQLGRSQSDLIREAIDGFLERHRPDGPGASGEGVRTFPRFPSCAGSGIVKCQQNGFRRSRDAGTTCLRQRCAT